MIDLNITTVLTTLLSVGGPLGGVFLGYTLNKGQDKDKRKRDIMEEFYGLTLKVYRHTQDLFGEEKYTSDLYEIIMPCIQRMAVLANLYLHPIKAQMKDFTDSLEALHKAHEEYFFVFDDPDKRAEAIEKLKRERDIYEKRYKNLKDALEKLVK